MRQQRTNPGRGAQRYPQSFTHVVRLAFQETSKRHGQTGPNRTQPALTLKVYRKKCPVCKDKPDLTRAKPELTGFAFPPILTLLIWGSGVRISSGAPPTLLAAHKLFSRSAFTRRRLSFDSYRLATLDGASPPARGGPRLSYPKPNNAFELPVADS